VARTPALLGGGWLYVVNRRRPGVLAEIEADLERVPELKEEVIEVFEHTHVHPNERILP
jgi:hypothetical protein